MSDETKHWTVWVDCHLPDFDDLRTRPGIAFDTVEARDVAMARLSRVDPRLAVEANGVCATELAPHRRPGESKLYDTLDRVLNERATALGLLYELKGDCCTGDWHDRSSDFLAALETP